MPSFDPTQLAAWADGQWTAPPGGALIGFNQDTRALRPGETFIALRTDKRDGHDYLPAAQTAGAAAAIVSTPAPALALPQLVVADPLAAFQKIAAAHRADCQAAGVTIIGISGSAGKTSTKELLALILAQAHGADRVLATEGNLNNHIGVPLTLTRIDPAQHKYAVIEAGISAPGEMEILAAMIAPDHAIITLIAPAHTQSLGGIEDVAREKAVLLQHVRDNGARLFPAGCLAYPAFANLPNSDLCDMSDPYGGFPFLSRGMSRNAALAIQLATRLGVSDSKIQTALASWKPAKWRGEVRRDSAGRLFYLDFYNANPASMSDALDAFTRAAPPALPRLYVIGCMEELGPDSPRYHRELGQSLSQRLRPEDEAIIIGDHAADIAAGSAAGSAEFPLGGLGGASRRPPSGNSALPAILIANTTAEIAARIAAFHGSIFLKGSRRHALENTLPPDFADRPIQNPPPC